MTLAALEATLIAYLEPGRALQEIRVLKALSEPLEAVRKRARRLMTLVRKSGLEGISLALRPGTAMAGGGSLPARDIPTWLVAVEDGRTLIRLPGGAAPATPAADCRPIADEEGPL